MRVISGSARGKKLLSLEGSATRPTTDRVKESMFNIVMPYIRDAKVLDLFAGSGALGIEALSRGAAHCTFLENARDAAAVIRKNLEGTKLSDSSKPVEGDALAFLDRTQESFSLIFLDPPYDGGFYEPVLEKIAKRGLLDRDGVLVLEKRADTQIIVPDTMEVEKERKYGHTTVCILKMKGRTKND